MTASITEYTSLITSEHAPRANFMATVAALVQPVADIRETIQGLTAAFDIDTAVGAQLDVVGEWLGQSRYIRNELEGVYFSFDTTDLGFDEGSWFQPGDSETGLTVLGDDAYRILLYAKAAINGWDGTVPNMVERVEAMLGPSGIYIALQDNTDMSIEFLGLIGEVPPVITQLFKTGYMNFKPAGVRINNYAVPSEPGTPFFGFGLDTDSVAGFGEGSWIEIL